MVAVPAAAFETVFAVEEVEVEVEISSLGLGGVCVEKGVLCVVADDDDGSLSDIVGVSPFSPDGLEYVPLMKLPFPPASS